MNDQTWRTRGFAALYIGIMVFLLGAVGGLLLWSDVDWIGIILMVAGIALMGASIGILQGRIPHTHT